ncbi:DUF3530 family protein [Marinicellulosiphila megalodicopiae]|uniref:DUF3530 family protein n=1 Tax=Marinicellulosiphila megalodicopiae TaxID=2724896 RepID=UPI003BB2148E
MSISSTLMADFAQSDQLLKRFPKGLYADQIVPIDYLPNAQTIAELPQDTISQFIGLLQTPRTNVPQGAILIIHDVGQNANWPNWIQPMRNYLPDTGWMTLSITIPSGKLYDQRGYDQMIQDRIAASINYLQNKGQFNLVLLGSGTGSFWIAKYLSLNMQGVDNFGYAMISVNAQDNTFIQAETFQEYLSTLTIPILDIFLPKNEYEKNKAKWRKGMMLSKNHPNYIQVKMHDSAFGVSSEYDLVTRRVWGWLKVNAAGQEAEVRVK